MSSGQPSVLNGQSHELNQVSSTSGSCSILEPPQCAQAAGSSRLTVISPQSAQYQTGMRWPHQSWREMFQSRMFSSQSVYVLVKRSGTICVWPYLHRAERAVRQRRHLDPPLHRDQRLDDGMAARAVAERNRVLLLLLQQVQPLELGDDALARDVAVLPGERPGFGGHLRVEADDLDALQVVPVPDLEVGRVVRGRYLDRARAKRWSTASSVTIGMRRFMIGRMA